VELLLYAIFCALILGASHRAVAQSPTLHPYRTPGAIALCGQLKTISPDSGSSIELPLLDWIASSLVRDQIPIWLDRRIPSDIELRLEIPSEQTCYAVLQNVAREIDAEVACVDRWVALVPVGFASRVEWAYWNSMTSQNTRLRTPVKNAIAWNDGTDTRQIWKSFLQSSGIPVASPSPLIDSEPDVWRAFRFEQTNAAAIATLLLSGFDQRLEYSADRPPTIESLSEAVIPTVAFQYSSEIPKIGKQAWQDWRARWQELKVDRLENSAGPNRDIWEILAPVAAHRELVDPLTPVPAQNGRSIRNSPNVSLVTTEGKPAGSLKASANNWGFGSRLKDYPPTLLGEKSTWFFKMRPWTNCSRNSRKPPGCGSRWHP